MLLGLANYYRWFVPNYAELTAPLFSSISGWRKKTLEWNSECEEAFAAIKAAIGDTAMLSQPDFAKPFILDTDASHVAIGALLSQYVLFLVQSSRKF